MNLVWSPIYCRDPLRPAPFPSTNAASPSPPETPPPSTSPLVGDHLNYTHHLHTFLQHTGQPVHELLVCSLVKPVLLICFFPSKLTSLPQEDHRIKRTPVNVTSMSLFSQTRSKKKVPPLRCIYQKCL